MNLKDNWREIAVALALVVLVSLVGVDYATVVRLADTLAPAIVTPAAPHNFPAPQPTASGATNFTNVNINGAMTSQSAAVSGNANVGGTLDVVGATTITGALTVQNLVSQTVGTQLGDGTAAAPSLDFTSDTDTGVYRIGANDIGLATGGAKIFDCTATACAAAGTFNSVGNFSVATNKFNVTAASGNTTIAGTLALGSAGNTFSGPIKYGSATNVISGTTIAHGLGVTPTIFAVQNTTLQPTTYTQTLYAYNCDTISCTVGISQGSVVTFTTVSWWAGQ